MDYPTNGIHLLEGKNISLEERKETGNQSDVWGLSNPNIGLAKAWRKIMDIKTALNTAYEFGIQVGIEIGLNKAIEIGEALEGE